ncbi:MAG: zinc-dependent metalloprotease [Bacteroidia bacterium]
MKHFHLVVLLALAFSLQTESLLAQSKKKKKSAPASTEAAKPDAPKAAKKPDIASKTKNTIAHQGLMTIYQDTSDGKTYLRLKKDQLGQEFIYWSYAENGLARVGLNRGSFRNNLVFKVERYFDRIDFEVQNLGFYFDPENPLSKSAEANVGNALLLSEKIVAEDEKTGDLLIEATNLFMDEKFDRVRPPRREGPAAAAMFGLGNLNKGKSKYVNIRSYPENTDVVVDLVYDNPNASNAGGKDVADPRAITVRIQHSIIAMPQNDYQPRRDDPRLGYFGQQVNDMTSVSATNYRDVINRWHLVKQDPEAAISEPVEPIVWWIENTTPHEFRDIIKRAGEMWNLAFEQAGFKNAVVMKVQPDSADWDAGDIRYNVLRWTSSPFPPFGGYGPSFVNPRTGQILGADIMLEYVFVTNRIKQSALFNNLGLLNLYDFDEDAGEHLAQDHGHSCHASAFLQHNFLLGMQALELSGASDEKKEQYLEESLFYLIMHEMGHTLGLNHNMKASQLHLPKDLHNEALTRELGLVGSVMDYPAVNLHRDQAKQGQFFTTRPGPYDMWVIEYGYSTAVADAAAEEARLNAILARSTRPELTFGNDADDMRSPGKAIDPRVNVNDMSGDAISYSIDRFELVNNLYAGLFEKYSKAGQSYQELLQAYSILGGETMNAASTISRYIGGVYVDRGFVGQEGSGKPFEPVSKADQQRAMKALERYVFAPNAFEQAMPLYEYLQVQRRGFGFFAQTEDPKIHQRALTTQRMVLAHLLHPVTLQRISDSRLYGNSYSLLEVFNELTDGIFKADMNGKVNSFRQNLQLDYVEKLIAIAGLNPKTPASFDYLSQSQALAQLNKLNTQLRTNPGADAETRAHRDHLRFKIDQAMKKS